MTKKNKHLPAVSNKGIQHIDSLSAYLSKISKYDKLTKEEEHELALLVNETQDAKAAYKLVTSNLWLVVKVARQYQKAAKNLIDLIQEGNVGLMEAVKNFDPHNGTRLPTYAVFWIKAYIVKYLIANFRMVKIGTTQAQRKLFFNLNKEKRKLEREGFYPGPKLLAEKLNVKEKDVIEMEQRMQAGDLSVDAPLGEENDSNFLNIFPGEENTAEKQLGEKQLKTLFVKVITEFKKTLKEKEVLILEKRLLSEKKVILQELSDQLNLSKERVRQIENEIKNKLKVFISDNYGDDLQSLDFEIS